MDDTTGTLDEALERLHASGPERNGWLSNHGPMAVEALVRNGQAPTVHRRRRHPGPAGAAHRVPGVAAAIHRRPGRRAGPADGAGAGRDPPVRHARARRTDHAGARRDRAQCRAARPARAPPHTVGAEPGGRVGGERRGHRRVQPGRGRPVRTGGRVRRGAVRAGGGARRRPHHQVHRHRAGRRRRDGPRRRTPLDRTEPAAL